MVYFVVTFKVVSTILVKDIKVQLDILNSIMQTYSFDINHLN